MCQIIIVNLNYIYFNFKIKSIASYLKFLFDEPILQLNYALNFKKIASKLNNIYRRFQTYDSKHISYFNKYLQQYILSVYPPLNNAAVRKVDASGSQTWMASFVFQPILKSLSVDAAEQSVYLASSINPLIVLKLAASDGSIVSQHQL